MKKLILLVALCAPLSAATGPSFDVAPTPGEPYWFKTYSTAPYKEIWSAELVVKNLDGELPKIVAAIQKNGGSLDQPPSNSASSRTAETQQLIVSVPGKKSKGVMKALRKLGRLADPVVRPQGVPIPIAEIRAKINLIMKEKSEHAKDLAKVPSAAAAQEEILEHLLLVEEVYQRTDTEIRVNLLVKQK
jgi:hypothetical protein